MENQSTNDHYSRKNRSPANPVFIGIGGRLKNVPRKDPPANADVKRLGVLRLPPGLAGIKKLDDGLVGDRHHGDDDDAEDDRFKMFLHPRDLSENNAGNHHEKNPEKASGHRVERELATVHGGHPGHERGQRPEDGEEARHDDCLRPVFLEEEVGAVEIILFKDEGVLLEDLTANGSSDGKVDDVSQDGRYHEDAHDNWPGKPGFGMRDAVGSNGEEERVTWEEGGYDQPRLAEDDGEENRVDPDAVEGNDVLEALVEVDEIFLKPVNEVHPAYEAGSGRLGNHRDAVLRRRMRRTRRRGIFAHGIPGASMIKRSVGIARSSGSALAIRIRPGLRPAR